MTTGSGLFGGGFSGAFGGGFGTTPPGRPRRPRRRLFDINADVSSRLQERKSRLATQAARREAQTLLGASLEAQQEIDQRKAAEQAFLARLDTLQAQPPVSEAETLAPPTGDDLLSRVVSSPVARPILGALSAFQDRVIEPLAGLAWQGGARALTGRPSEMEQRARELQSQGMGPVEAAQKAYQESQLPSTEITLPFTVRGPQWLTGERSIKDVQLGVKGAVELAVDPLNLLGISTVRRAVTTPVSAAAKSLGLGRKAVKSAEALGVAPNTPLSKTLDAWDVAQAPVKPGLREAVTSRYLAWQETVTDKYARGNRLTSQAKKWWEETSPGTPFPEHLDFEMQAANLSGAVSAGADKGMEVLRDARRLAGDVDLRFVDAYVQAKHLEEVARMKGPKRLLPQGQTITDLQATLNDIANTVGPANFQKVESAAQRVQTAFQKRLEDLVRADAVDPAMANELLNTYPWYYPIRYYELIEELGEGTGGRALSVVDDGIRRLSEVGAEATALRPTETIINAFIRSELLIARQRASKALIGVMQNSPETADLVRRVKTVVPVAKVGEKVTPAKTVQDLRAELSQLQRDLDAARPGGVDTARSLRIEDRMDVLERQIRRGQTIPEHIEPELLFRPKKGEIRGTISTLEAGQRVAYEAPVAYERMAKSLAALPLSNIESIGRTLNALPRAFLTTYNPAFMASNFLFDTMTVATTQGVLPHRVGIALYRNLRSLLKEDKTLQQMIRAGGDVSGFWGKAPEEALRDLQKTGNLAFKDDAGWRKLYSSPWELVRDVGHAIELAPRRAVFEKALAKGSSESRAAFLARRSTVDFQRSGTALRFANNFYLYLNAGVQGSLLPWRALRDSPIARIGIAGYMGATVAAYAWNRQFPEYRDVSLRDKYGSFGIMLPSQEVNKRGQKVAHFVAIVPVLREFSALSGPLLYTLQKMDEKNPEELAEFLGAVVPDMFPVSPLLRPQGLVPTYWGQSWAEVANNKDGFSGRDIVPQELQARPAADQFDEFNSEISIRVGRWLNVSPKWLDHFLKTGLGWDLVSSADVAIRAMTDGEDPQVEQAVAWLKEIQETYPAEDIPRLRRLLLNSLSPDLRKKVQEGERKPEPTLPFVSSIQRRFYRKQGGQLYRSGLREAAKQKGIPEQQLREAVRTLAEVSDGVFTAQQHMDADLETGKMSGQQWREARKLQGASYQAAQLVIGMEMPEVQRLLEDPAARRSFYDDVYTIAGKIQDTRSRSDFLLAAYRSIPVREIATGVEDWPAYFDDRDAFLNGLTKEERNRLTAELEARSTPKEREYTRGLEKYRKYFSVAEELLNHDPVRVEQYRNYQKLSSGPHTPQALEIAQRNNPWVVALDRQVTAIRQQMRQLDQDLEAFLLRFGYVDVPTHQANLDRLGEIAPYALTAMAQAGVR